MIHHRVLLLSAALLLIVLQVVPAKSARFEVAPENVPSILSQEDVHSISAEDVGQEVEPRRSYMSVRIVSSSGGRMCVICWSGDHNNDRSGCSTGPSNIVVLSWDFISGSTTKFWCNAAWGTKYLSRFPVFGDGVPKKSSEWKVDGTGKRRTHENGSVTNDYFRAWTSTAK